MSSFNPELHIEYAEPGIRNKLIHLLTELKGFKFVMTLVIEFKKTESNDATKHTTLYSNSKAETIINNSNIVDAFESICTTIISNIQKYFGKDLGWTIGSVVS